MEKTFDAVMMVRKIRDKHYEETRNMTYKDRMALYRNKSREILQAKINRSENVLQK